MREICDVIFLKFTQKLVDYSRSKKPVETLETERRLDQNTQHFCANDVNMSFKYVH